MESRDEIRERIVAQREAMIDKHGWAAVHVAPTEGDPGVAFTYTVGFEGTFRRPEIVVVGFDPRTAHVVLSGFADGLKSGEIDWPDGAARVSRIIRDYDIGLRPVPAALVPSIARAAVDREAPGRVRLVQALLPDPNGLLPGEDGCREDFVALQDIQAIDG